MEEAAQSIRSLVSAYLPSQPHLLSVSATARYTQHLRENRLEEDAIPPLGWMSFLHDVDRGILLTRPYYDIRPDPEPVQENAPSPPKARPDPSKPVTKLSLKDYKNRKNQDPPLTSTPPTKTKDLVIKTKEREPVPAPKKYLEVPSATRDMNRDREIKKAHPSLPPKPDIRRPQSPPPEKKKRPTEVPDDERAVKRTKFESPATNGKLSQPPSKSATPQLKDRPAGHERKPSKDLKSSALTNGRSGLGNSTTHGASPRPSSQVNGSQKSVTSHHGTPKKEKGDGSIKSNSSVPPLLSPLHFGSLDKGEDTKPPKASSVKKPADSKPPPSKKPRDEPDPMATPKMPRSKIPPLLSPLPNYLKDEVEKGIKNGTLPPLGIKEQSLKSTPTRDMDKKHAGVADSQSTARKGPVKTGEKEKEDKTIHVESKKGVELRDESPSWVVKMKYPKRLTKTISRLLALTPKKTDPAKREALEAVKKEDTADRIDSLEPTATARKRPRGTAEGADPPTASKRPRTSEIGQPSTPSKQSAAMQRVASSSSQANTPGAAGSTPAPPSSDRRPAPPDPEMHSRLRKRYVEYQQLGTRLKHVRDKYMKPKDGGNVPPNASPEERQFAMAAVIQSSVAYMVSFQASDQLSETDGKAGDIGQWKSLLTLMRTYRHDCKASPELSALLLRLYTISMTGLSRSIRLAGTNNIANAKELFQNMKAENDWWKMAQQARLALGDGVTDGEDGGKIARLIDRLGPWSQPDEMVPIVLRILKWTIKVEAGFTPVRELLDLNTIPATNGTRNP